MFGKKQEKEHERIEETPDEGNLSEEEQEMMEEIMRAYPPQMNENEEQGGKPFFSRNVESEIDLRSQKLLTPEYHSTRRRIKDKEGKIQEVYLDFPELYTSDWLSSFLSSHQSELVKDHAFLINLYGLITIEEGVNLRPAAWFIATQMFTSINLSRADGKNVDRAVTSRSQVTSRQTRQDIPPPKIKRFGIG